MTALACEFPDKIRLYDQVLKSDNRRLFVPTEQELSTGQTVQVQINVSGHEPLTATGKVVAKRPRSVAGQAAGVWLQFDAGEADALRRLLEIGEGEGASLTVRGSPRFEASLPVLIDKPIRMPLRTKNVSAGGVCLAGILPLPVGQTIRLTLEFLDQPITLFGKIAWRRDEAHQVGVQFRFQSDEVRQAVAKHVQRLSDETTEQIRSNPRMLVVDDDVGTLRAIERLLNSRGYGILTATSGPEALSLAREHSPSLVLLDVLLPGMNGLEVCRALKRDVGTSRIPVVLTSVLPQDNLEMLLKDAGGLVALAKPYRFETLVELAQRLTERKPHEVEAPLPPSDGERRGQARVPLFERCIYEGEGLRLEGRLKEASEHGVFLVSNWGEPVGSRGHLTILSSTDVPVRLEAEVVHRVDWGVWQSDQAPRVPGMGLKFVDGTSQAEFGRWLSSYRELLEGRPLVMVVDDDRSHLELLRMALRKAGCGVITLDSPLGVMQAVSMAPPKLLIIDYMMPGMDGGSLCRTIKQNPATASIPVWLYSSVSEESLERLQNEAGADGYVRKGERLTELAGQVAAFVGAQGWTRPG